jgi:hypothetical protein
MNTWRSKLRPEGLRVANIYVAHTFKAGCGMSQGTVYQILQNI